jgi:hypothetical protein
MPVGPRGAPYDFCMSPRRVRRTRLVLYALGAVLVAWMAVVAVTLWNVRESTRRGIDRLEEARDVLSPRAVANGDGQPELRQARGDFDDAHAGVRAPWIAPLRILPVVGRQVRSVDSLTGAARDVVDTGLDAMEQSQRALASEPADGPARVELADRLSAVARTATARLETVDLGPDNALVGPLHDARNRFATELARIDDAAARLRDASSAFSGLLRGPSRYLVLAANNNEMRTGSGMFLSAGVLEIDDGVLDVSDFTPTGELALPAGAVQISGDFADRWGFQHPSQEWRNLASSPVFPVQGELATRMWKAKTGEDVDGVIVLDPIALQRVLEVTGPVVVEGKQYTHENVLDEIYVRQYIGLTGSRENAARRDHLSDVASATLGQLNTQGWSAADLVESLRRAAAGRHVLAWSRDERQQRGWAAAGLAGALAESSLMIGVDNAGGNKLDRFLDIDAALEVDPRDDGVHTEVDVMLDNVAPPGLPQYVEGPLPGLEGSVAGSYRGLLVLQMPGGSRDVQVLDGAGRVLRPAVLGRDGANETVAVPFDLPRGASAAFTVRFVGPGELDRFRIEPSARYPAVHWRYGTREWDDTREVTVSW